MSRSLRELYYAPRTSRSLLRSLEPNADASVPTAAVDPRTRATRPAANSAAVTATPWSAPAPHRKHYEHGAVCRRSFDTLAGTKLAAAPLISFDTETDSLDYMRAQLVGLSFAVAPAAKRRTYRWRTITRGRPAQLDRDRMCSRRLKPLLEDPRRGRNSATI